MNQLTITHTRSAVATWPNWNVPALFGIPYRIMRALETWRRGEEESGHFSYVEARILQDIGISETRRLIEVNKPFWED